MYCSGYGSREAVEGNPSAVSYLSNVIKHHILPPTPDTRAVWTTPFMRAGASMGTLTVSPVRAEGPTDGKVRAATCHTCVYICQLLTSRTPHWKCRVHCTFAVWQRWGRCSYAV